MLLDTEKFFAYLQNDRKSNNIFIISARNLLRDMKVFEILFKNF